MNQHRKAARFSQTKAATKQNLHVDYIKSSINPFDFYRHELPGAILKRPSWNDGGLCPFHSDNRPGSFRVNLATGAYKCFACDMSGGNIIAFTMAYYSLEFMEALKKLADEWGLA